MAEETPPRYCSVCRHELKPEDLSCPKCGTPLILAAEVPTPEADRAVPPPPQLMLVTLGHQRKSSPPKSRQRSGAGGADTLSSAGVWGSS